APADTPEGIVLRQDPSHGDPVRGGAVDLTISRHAAPAPSTGPAVPPTGPAPTATAGTGSGLVVPDLVGRLEADALAMLKERAISYVVSYEDTAVERNG